jgi:hypothetical protein
MEVIAMTREFGLLCLAVPLLFAGCGDDSPSGGPDLEVVASDGDERLAREAGVVARGVCGTVVNDTMSPPWSNRLR